MPQYFKDASGKMHEFPDDATPEEIYEATRALAAPAAVAPAYAPAAEEPPEDILADENPIKVQGAALVNSLRNTGAGLIQTQAEGIDLVVDNPVTRAAAGALGLGDQQQAFAGVTGGRVDQLRQDQSRQQEVEGVLQRNPVFRQSDSTFDVAQVVAPGTATARATQGATLLGRLGADALMGAVQSGSQALGEGDSREAEAWKGAGYGAAGTAIGATLSRAGRGLSDQIRPAVREMYNAVKARGIQPNITGLLDDGALKTTAEFLQSLPFAGGAKAITRELGEFTREVGKTFGINEKELSKAAMDRARSSLSAQYDAALQGAQVVPDTHFVARVNQILRDAPQSIDAPQREILKQNVQRLINAAAVGSMPATLYQELRGVLATNARRTGAQGVSDHISDLREALDEAAVRSIAQVNPQAAAGLMNLNRSWANLSKADELLEAGGGRAGIVTPKQAAAATKPSTSATAGPRSTTQMRDLAQAAEKTGVGSGARELPWWQKLTAGGAAAAGGVASLPVAATLSGLGIAAGRGLNSRAGARYLAEGLPAPTRRLLEELGILTRAAPAASTRAKKRKELTR